MRGLQEASAHSVFPGEAAEDDTLGPPSGPGPPCASSSGARLSLPERPGLGPAPGPTLEQRAAALTAVAEAAALGGASLPGSRRESTSEPRGPSDDGPRLPRVMSLPDILRARSASQARPRCRAPDPATAAVKHTPHRGHALGHGPLAGRACQTCSRWAARDGALCGADWESGAGRVPGPGLEREGVQRCGPDCSRRQCARTRAALADPAQACTCSARCKLPHTKMLTAADRARPPARTADADARRGGQGAGTA